VAHLGSGVLHCSKLTFGRASAPMMPQRVHTMRRPKVGTGTSSDHGFALMIARDGSSGMTRSAPVGAHVAEGHGLDSGP
jgi:hypothetical protein